MSGGAADSAVAPAANCFVLPDGMHVADAALIEPLSCAVRGFDRLGSQLADDFLIYGAGTMGLMMMELAKRAGAATVSMVDVNDSKLETARTLGCDNAVTSADELDAPYGWGVVIDCTGVVAIEDGLPTSTAAARSFSSGKWSPHRTYIHEITITGSMAVLHSFERAAALFVSGAIRPEIVISHRLPLPSYRDGLEQFKAGMGHKVLIEPGRSPVAR